MSHPLSPHQYEQDSQAPTSPGNEVPARGPANEVVQSSDMDGAQLESRYGSYRDAAGNLVERQESVFDDRNQRRANLQYRATAIIYFLLSVLEVILLLRLVFRLLAANTGNGFVTFLYNLSQPFVAPFQGIFGDLDLGRNYVLEFSTLIAMLIYMLLAWGLVSLLTMLFRPNYPGHQRTLNIRRRFW